MDKIYPNFLKRLLDVTMSALLILLVSPFLLIIFLALSVLSSESPVFFQQRPGRNHKLFTLYKFRTMHQQPSVFLQRFSLFLRKYSLDELPQLINVLFGDMALVGPRPLLVEYLPLYNKTQQRRHAVKPGLTGLAQIKGRNGLAWEEKFRYDIWYVQNLTLALDIFIILQSVKTVLLPENVKEQGLLEHEKFLGNSKPLKLTT